MEGRGTSRHLKFREPLGRGGFGTVYLADLRGGQGLMQRVAVKILHAGNPDESEVSARQRDEARLLAQLNHDHIVKVYDLIEVEGRPAVIMEYIDGVDAETWVKRGGPLPARAALQIVSGVASALDAAYNTESPVTGRPLCAIHRDVKPANVLISLHGAVKVLDFGVARADLDRDAETRDAQAMGTLAFISPEQWMFGSITSAVDIYALGLTLLRLLTGQVVERIPLSPEKYRARVAELVGLLDIADWPASWRAELQTLVTSMLAWDAEGRPSARDVEERCLALSEGAPGDGLAVLARKQVPNLVDERRRRYGQSSIILPGDVTMTMTSVVPSTAPTLAPRAQPKGAARPPLGLIVGGVAGGLLAGLALVGAGLWLALQEPEGGAQATATTTATAKPAVVSETRRREPTSAPSPTATAAATSTVAPTASGAPTTTATTSAKTSATSTPSAATATATATTAKTAKTADAGTSTKASAASALPTFPLTVSSVPLGAELKVDGKVMGSTPVRDLTLPEGEHRLELTTSDGRASKKTVRVGEHTPSRYIWRADGDTWESGI